MNKSRENVTILTKMDNE